MNQPRLAEPLLLVKGVTKSFPGVIALDNVSLRLEAGRMVALVGENGAGKSTLMGILAGVTRPDSGEIWLDGQVTQFSSARAARDAGIATIFQELSLVPNLSVAENIYLGTEPTRFGRIDRSRMNRAARKVLERLGLAIAAEALVSSLRAADKQGVEIARAISRRVRVVIMDEPTSSLGRAEIEHLLKLVAELKRDGIGILYITHKFEELESLADDIAVMRDGKLLVQAPYGKMSHEEIIRLMVGRENQESEAATRPVIHGGSALSVKGLSVPHPTRRKDFVVREVSLEVRRGEIVVLFGLVGAGRTECLEAIFGVHGGRMSGDIRVQGGELLNASHPADAVRAGLGLVPEDRKHQGLILGMSSRENAALACIGLRQDTRFLSARKETTLIGPILKRLRLRAGSLGSAVRNLSGGNQQKVVLAKWLAIRPKVLLLDEPTRGIDVNARGEFYDCIRHLAADGVGILVASSEIAEVLHLADRVVVLSQGRQTGEFSRREATPERLLAAALPRSQSGLSPS